MATNPTTLAALQYEEHVIRTNRFAIEAVASEYFSSVFSDNRDVCCRKLFVEDQYTVYECYTDSGSSDYVYIISYK